MNYPSSIEQRIDYLDLLRLFAAFAVIVLHTSAQSWSDADISAFPWMALNLWDSAVRWAVPVFAMISGALFLERDILPRDMICRYLPRIVISFAVWSALYAAYDYSFVGGGAGAFLYLFLRGHYHLWFLYMIAGLYLVLGILGFLFTAGATAAASRAAEYPLKVFYHNLSLNVLAESVAVFTFGKYGLARLRMSDRARRTVRKLSGYTFGVYLIHPFILDLFYAFGFTTTSFAPLLAVPLLAVCVGAVSLGLSWLLNQIPFLRNRIV